MTQAAPIPRCSSVLVDSRGRAITYLRLAITDRCNLRCVYCMPADGIRFLPRHEILTFEELERLTRLLVTMGINKVRVTGGEPFVRRGAMQFLRRLASIQGLSSLHVTTNGVLTAPLIPGLKEMGAAGINVSLDALCRERFMKVTRRDLFDGVLQTLQEAMRHDMPLKINAVVQDEAGADAIIPLSRLAYGNRIEVRFLEQMPFNGTPTAAPAWDATRILRVLTLAYPEMTWVERPGSTAAIYTIPGFAGTIGIIGGHSRAFCESCSRIRITPAGRLQTCLYEGEGLDLKRLLRDGATDRVVEATIRARVSSRARDGFEAEARGAFSVSPSMATIGG